MGSYNETPLYIDTLSYSCLHFYFYEKKSPNLFFIFSRSRVCDRPTMASPKKISLKSSDGESFEVLEVVALESQTIKHMIEDDCANSVIPLPNVTSKILAKVLEYCNRHVEAASKTDDRATEEELKNFDADFVKVDQGTLFDLILVCFNYNRFRENCVD